MLIRIFSLYALLPLFLVHSLGAILGFGLYLFAGKFGSRHRKNLKQARLADSIEYRKLEFRSFLECGKGMLETPVIWFRQFKNTVKLVRECSGWSHVEEAHAQGRGIIFLTPHLGCYEVTSLFYGSHHPITVLYRPPRRGWLEPLLAYGRARGQVELAPTNMSGVKRLLKALKNGEAIGILPDQVPEPNEGEWTNFFGRPAYTMNLATRLAQSSGAVVLMAYGERLSWGRGYHIRIEPLGADVSPQAINLAIESLIRQVPAQYLWSYRRYKKP